MSAIPIRRARDETVELLREIRDLLKDMRADLRKRKDEAVPALLGALEEYFGSDGRFTAGGLLKLAEENQHGAMADVLAELVDMNAGPRSRATALGALLRRLPELEPVAQQRGVAVYRLRTSTG